MTPVTCRFCSAVEDGANKCDEAKAYYVRHQVCSSCAHWLRNADADCPFMGDDDRIPVVYEDEKGLRQHACTRRSFELFLDTSTGRFVNTKGEPRYCEVAIDRPAKGAMWARRVYIQKLFFQGEIPDRFHDWFPINATLVAYAADPFLAAIQAKVTRRDVANPVEVIMAEWNSVVHDVTARRWFEWVTPEHFPGSYYETKPTGPETEIILRSLKAFLKRHPHYRDLRVRAATGKPLTSLAQLVAHYETEIADLDADRDYPSDAP